MAAKRTFVYSMKAETRKQSFREDRHQATQIFHSPTHGHIHKWVQILSWGLCMNEF